DRHHQTTVDIRHQGLEDAFRVEAKRIRRLEPEAGDGCVVLVGVRSERETGGGQGEGCGGDHDYSTRKSCIDVGASSMVVPGACASGPVSSRALSHSSTYPATPSCNGRVTCFCSSIPLTMSRMLFGFSASGVDEAKYCRVRSSGESQSSIDIDWPS